MIILTKQQINEMPVVIQKRIEDLNRLVEEHPIKIPTVKAAKILGMYIECFRRAIEQGKIPFALGCDNDTYGNRYSYVSSLTFYLWCLSPSIL